MVFVVLAFVLNFENLCHLVQSMLPVQVHVQSERKPDLCIVAANRNNVSNFFPNTSSESDLQRYRAVWDRSSRERKSPSLSNVASDSLRHKVRSRRDHVPCLYSFAFEQWKALVKPPFHHPQVKITEQEATFGEFLMPQYILPASFLKEGRTDVVSCWSLTKVV